MTPRPNIAYAAFLQQQGEPERALEYFLAAVRASPNPLTLNTLGVALNQMDRAGEAVTAHQAALAMAPDPTSPAHGESALMLALAAIKLPDPPLAVRSFLAALNVPVHRPRALEEASRYLTSHQPDSYLADVETLLLQLITDKAVNPVPLRTCAQGLLTRKPSLQSALAATGADQITGLAGEGIVPRPS